MNQTIDPLDNPRNWLQNGDMSARNPQHPKHFEFAYDPLEYVLGLLEAGTDNPEQMEQNARIAIAHLYHAREALEASKRKKWNGWDFTINDRV